MDTCSRIIAAMSPSNLVLVTCHPDRASRQGVGRALQVCGVNSPIHN